MLLPLAAKNEHADRTQNASNTHRAHEGRSRHRGIHTVGMSFFDPPPAPPEPFVQEPQPEWSGPPDNVLGAPLSIRFVLARTDDVAVAVTGGTVYPTGVSFDVGVRMRVSSDDQAEKLHEAMMM